jgi:hypothetical protein
MLPRYTEYLMHYTMRIGFPTCHYVTVRTNANQLAALLAIAEHDASAYGFTGIRFSRPRC